MKCVYSSPLARPYIHTSHPFIRIFTVFILKMHQDRALDSASARTMHGIRAPKALNYMLCT